MYSADGLVSGWMKMVFVLVKEIGIHQSNRWIVDPSGPPVGDRLNSSVADDADYSF
jgi:hypothetical protein